MLGLDRPELGRADGQHASHRLMIARLPHVHATPAVAVTHAGGPIGSDHVLEVDELVRTYGTVRALDGMTFAVRPGAVTGFLGPNGAGKTTTMRAIFGLTALDAGRSAGTAADRPAARRRFGYLPEERGLYPTMRVPDQLRYLGQLRGLDKHDGRPPAGALARAPRSRRPAGDDLEDLSLGNQQRVQLIGALIHEPDVSVLDEPFSGLDPVAVDALSKVLVAEARRGATVLFSSHQLDLVEDLCERAVVVDRGRVVAEGTIDDLTAGADPVLEIDVPDDPDGTWTASSTASDSPCSSNTSGGSG